MKIKTLCVIGIGLIGGSLARSLRKHDWCQSIVAIDTNQNALEQALALKLIDQGYTEISQCPIVPDVIVIAVPVLRVAEVFKQLESWLSECAAITDVSSTKQNIIDDYLKIYSDKEPSCFVPAHPIAGSECSGVEASVEDLFENRKVILTPIHNTREDSLELVTQMWQQAGAHIELLSADEHDKILAATSHLPHAIAYSLVHCLSTHKHTDEIFRYAAGGFADFTRIASSDPVVWREICLANRKQLLAALEHFDSSLQRLRDSLKDGDGDAIQQIFSEAKAARDRYSHS